MLINSGRGRRIRNVLSADSRAMRNALRFFRYGVLDDVGTRGGALCQRWRINFCVRVHNATLAGDGSHR